jgi:hypothetical protein
MNLYILQTMEHWIFGNSLKEGLRKAPAVGTLLG